MNQRARDDEGNDEKPPFDKESNAKIGNVLYIESAKDAQKCDFD